MSLSSRLDSLRDRHASLEARIFDEDLRPQPNNDAIVRLKREKLRIKEEMERLKGHASTH